MSQSIDSQGWDRFKNVIRGLYMTKGHKLEGAEGVIKIMENQHRFKKTKAQYEKQLKIWGFTKYRSKRDWEIMNRKIQLRKRTGKDSDIYMNRQLMPAEKLRKETSRQGYMTAVEQARLAFEAPPQTPPGFDIRTPLAQPFFRLAFENLPIFQFKEFAQPVYGTVAPSDMSTPAITMMFQLSGRQNDSAIHPIIDSLLPMSAFFEEPRAAGLAMQRVENTGQAELLNLATFIASNNFPGDTNDEKLQEWLKTHCTTSVVEALWSMKGPTAEALLEKVFRFAIEDEDVSTAKYLLQLGVNPNGHQCRYYGDDNYYLTPLQFALVQGNTELALELIKAGSTTDQPNIGWKSSALVLAIFGDRMRSSTALSGNSNKNSGVFEDGDGEEYEPRDTRYGDDDYLATQEEANRLVALIGSLINAGAVVNLSDIGQLRPTQSEISEKLRQLEVDEPVGEQLCFLLNYDEVHTPLSIASRLHRTDIVDLIIRKDADVNFLTDQGTSALHECLYNLYRMATNLVFGFQSQLQDQDLVSRDYNSLDRVVGVVQSLIDAGANVHEEFNCRTIYLLPDDYSGPESYTIFDLGVLTGSMKIVNMLISAGAQITALSVEYAIQFESLDVFNRSLHATASVSTNSAIITINRQDKCPQALLTKGGNIWIKEVALLKAIRFGHASTIEYLFRDGDFGCRDVLYKSTELVEAIENCCGGGHIRALLLVLQDSLKGQFSLSPWFGDSLYRAIWNRWGEIVDTLLSAGADVNVMTRRGRTPLFAAIITENEVLVRHLISMGAVLNPNTPYSATCSSAHGISGDALTAAIFWGSGVMINHLLEMGADIEAFGCQRYQMDSCLCIRPLTAAIIAKNSDLVNDLIRRGAKVHNPLDHAPPCGDLIRGGAKVHNPLDHALPYELRMTPLAAAFENRDFEMADFVINEGGDPYDRRAAMETRFNFRLRRVLINAMHRGHQPSDIEPIENGLTAAIIVGDVEVLTALLCRPIRDIQSGSTLSSALKLAIEFSRLITDTTIWVSNSRLVQVLLEAGAEAGTSMLSDGCYSPLQSAVKGRNHEVAQTLLDYGSNPNSVSIAGKYQNSDCRMPLQLAVNNRDIEMIRILFRYRADANGDFIDDEETDDDIDVKYFVPRTPLQEASFDGSKVIVELLLEHGADVNSPPIMEDGATALQYAAMQGFLGIAHLLLEHDADVNAPPAKTDGRTALEGAAEHGRLDMVQLLLNAGANIFGDGQAQYENAIRRASENGHHAIRRMLEKHRADRE